MGGSFGLDKSFTVEDDDDERPKLSCREPERRIALSLLKSSRGVGL